MYLVPYALEFQGDSVKKGSAVTTHGVNQTGWGWGVKRPPPQPV